MMNNSDVLDEKNLLRVENVTKRWKDFTLGPISFSLPEGYILGLIGKNGAGKSTLMNCIMGAMDYEGCVVVEDSVNTIHEKLAMEKVGFIVEDAPFFKKKSLHKNGELLGNLYEKFDMDKFHKLLISMGLYLDVDYQELSKGMEMKFQLAFALSHSPRLLLLDEPTGNLDPVFRKTFLAMLQKYVSEEMLSVIISTHLTADLDKVADYIMLLDEGRMVFFEDKETLMDRYPLVSGNVQLLNEIKKQAYKRISKRGGLFQTIFTDVNYLEQHPELANQLTIQRTNLEDIMYYMSTSFLNL